MWAQEPTDSVESTTIGIDPIAIGIVEENAVNDSLSTDSIPSDTALMVNVDETTPKEFDFERELEWPEIPNQQLKTIQSHMRNLGEKYLSKGFRVVSTRDGAVIRISVPSDNLFNPNDTTLSENASRNLTHFLPLIKNNKDYKVLLSVHCDNTGNKEYQSLLTEGRMYAIFEWFDSNVSSKESALINGEYCGSDESATYFDENEVERFIDNRSRENRKANRRIEFYIIPNSGLIQKARNKVI